MLFLGNSYVLSETTWKRTVDTFCDLFGSSWWARDQHSQPLLVSSGNIVFELRLFRVRDKTSLRAECMTPRLLYSHKEVRRHVKRPNCGGIVQDWRLTRCAVIDGLQWKTTYHDIEVSPGFFGHQLADNPSKVAPMRKSADLSPAKRATFVLTKVFYEISFHISSLPIFRHPFRQVTTIRAPIISRII